AKERSRDKIPFWGRPWSIWFLVIASVVISGLRTASLFVALANTDNTAVAQFVEGIFAVAMIEVGIVLTGFRAEQLRRESLGKARHVASLLDLLRGIKVRLGIEQPLSWAEKPEPSIIPALHNILFLVALVANVWVTAKTALLSVPGASEMDVLLFTGSLLGQPVPIFLPVLVALMAGAAAPIAAKAAGEAAARDMFRDQVEDEKVDLSYDQAFAMWQDGFRQAWESEGTQRLEDELYVQEARTRGAAPTIQMVPNPIPHGGNQHGPFDQ
ncbi:MAG: hypothetical protein JXB47_02840, partial [Anaerolineae bacterium]|nr:hypothetical protein [Anaerolineae bacterium]